MIIGVLVIAFIISATMFSAALALSYPVWLAALVYAGTGSLLLIAGGALLALLPDDTSSDLPQQGLGRTAGGDLKTGDRGVARHPAAGLIGTNQYPHSQGS